MVEYLKTLGEELGDPIKQIGGALMDVVNPNYKYQVMLKESLAKNPELIGQLATIAKDNPGALEGVFGKGSSGFFANLHETPDAQLKRSMTGAAAGALKGKEEDVGRVALGLPTQLGEQKDRQSLRKGEVDIEGAKLDNQGKQLTQAGQVTQNARDRITLEREKSVAKFIQSLPPEVRNDVMFKDLTGMLQVDYSKAQERAASMDQAVPWLNKSPKDIRKAYKQGLLSDQALQGLWDLHPDAMKMILKDMESDEAWAMRAAMAKDAKTNRRLDIMSELYKETAKHASEIGANPAALFEARYGFKPDEIVPNAQSKYAPEDVENARTLDQKAAKAKRAQALVPVLNAYKILQKTKPDKGVGAAGMFNATADAAGVDLRVEVNPGVDEGWFKFDKPKYQYFWNGQPVDEKTAEKLMSGDQGHTGVEPTDKPTTSEQELSSERAKSMVEAAKKSKMDFDTISTSSAFARLSPEEKLQVKQALGK